MILNKLFERNKIKEGLQDKILEFIYNSTSFNKLIFTGGTCLRKIYGLNRLSEDLDFDYSSSDGFDLNNFAKQTEDTFEIKTKISGNRQTVFLKYPNSIFLRCDFSGSNIKPLDMSQSLILADNKQFFVNTYTLPVLFANKIDAFLNRNFLKGKYQKIPFKGRDIYDLFWLLQLSAKSGYTLKPDISRLSDIINIKEKIKEKIRLVEKEFVFEDLFPLIESKEYLDQFLQSFSNSITSQIDFVL
jgi:predicted nucleotidyltransferase component of viral defense system